MSFYAQFVWKYFIEQNLLKLASCNANLKAKSRQIPQVSSPQMFQSTNIVATFSIIFLPNKSHAKRVAAHNSLPPEPTHRKQHHNSDFIQTIAGIKKWGVCCCATKDTNPLPYLSWYPLAEYGGKKKLLRMYPSQERGKTNEEKEEKMNETLTTIFGLI